MTYWLDFTGKHSLIPCRILLHRPSARNPCPIAPRQKKPSLSLMKKLQQNLEQKHCPPIFVKWGSHALCEGQCSTPCASFFRVRLISLLTNISQACVVWLILVRKQYSPGASVPAHRAPPSAQFELRTPVRLPANHKTSDPVYQGSCCKLRGWGSC